jgi:plastocyanin
MTRRTIAGHMAAAAGMAVMLACGGSPTGPSTGTGNSGGGGAGTSGATVTMTANGVNPASVAVSVGQSVTFVNNDSRSHQIASDPHPTHGSCPQIEVALGTIAAGETKLTNAFTTAKTCTYHDHLDPGNAAFQGSIRIQ